MYIRLINGVPTPYTIKQLRKDEGISCRDNPPDDILAKYGVYPYTVPDVIYNPETETLDPAEFRQVAGAWQKVRPVRDLTAEELRARMPKVVSMRQARLALLAAGKLGQINSAISAASEAEQIEWEYAADVRRDNPLLLTIAARLKMTEAEIDALFVAASKL